MFLTGLIAMNMLFNFMVRVVMAALFGAGAAVDAFLVASTIPTVLRTLVHDSLGIVLIPFLGRAQNTHGAAFVERAKGTLLLATLVGSFLLTGTALLMTGALIHLIAPGLSESTTELAVRLARPLLISAGLFLAMGPLIFFAYLHDRYLLPHWIILIQPSVTILVAGLAYRSMGISALAVGQLGGTALQLAVFFPYARSAALVELRLPLIGLDHLKRVSMDLGPAMFSLLPVSFVPLADRFFASSLPVGSISYISYSWMLAAAFGAVLSRGLGTTMLSTLARVDSDDFERFQRILGEGLGFFIWYALPTTIVLFLLREQVVSLVLLRGSFTQADANIVARLFGWHVIGAAGLALFTVLGRAMYALQEFGWTAKLGWLFLPSYVIVLALGRQLMQLEGLAAGNAVAWWATSMFLLTFLVKRGVLEVKVLWNAYLLPCSVGATVMAIVAGFGTLPAFRGSAAVLVAMTGAGGVAYVFATEFLFDTGITRRLLGRTGRKGAF